MTTEQRARAIADYTNFIQGADALDFIWTHLNEVYKQGLDSGKERAVQALLRTYEDRQ